MIAGFALQDRPRRVIGIDGSAKPAETRAQVARIARHTAGLIGLERDLRDDEIILDERYHAGTYGIPDDATLEAIRLAGRLEGMITDPVYEGKSMAGTDRPDRARRDRARLERALRASRRAARAQRLRGAVRVRRRIAKALWAAPVLLAGSRAARPPRPTRRRARGRRSPSSCRTWAGVAPRTSAAALRLPGQDRQSPAGRRREPARRRHACRARRSPRGARA